MSISRLRVPACGKDDPEAYKFIATKYSAYKMLKEVVDTSATAEGGMHQLMEGWKRALDKQIEEDADGPG
jgi:hypothetical protein